MFVQSSARVKWSVWMQTNAVYTGQAGPGSHRLYSSFPQPIGAFLAFLRAPMATRVLLLLRFWLAEGGGGACKHVNFRGRQEEGWEVVVGRVKMTTKKPMTKDIKPLNITRDKAD